MEKRTERDAFRSYLPAVNRYKNIVTQHAGRSFASKLEAALFDLLCLMEKGGLVKDILCQQSVYLTDARIQYIADFSVTDLELDTQVWYEAKGFETDVWRIKRRLWKMYGPGILRVYKGSAKNLKLTEEIIPQPAKLF